MIISTNVDVNTRKALKALFPDDDFIMDQQFTLLHQIVLELSTLDLNRQLADSPNSMINKRDTAGRTALWWAAHNANYEAISSLLSYGANPNIQSSTGYSALNAALAANDPKAVRLLLDNHCDMALSPEGWTPLHACAFYGSDLDILETIIARRVDINAVTPGHSGVTPLMFAAQENFPRICEYLITRGAELNWFTEEGETALHIAVQFSSNEALSCLLQNHAVYTVKAKTGESILHLAAQFGNLQCLRTLHAHNLGALNADDQVINCSDSQRFKHIKGQNALQISARRDDVTPEWHVMFRELIDGIKFPERKIPGGSTDANIGEFFDALEQPSL